MPEFAADKRTKGRLERLIHKNRLFLFFFLQRKGRVESNWTSRAERSSSLVENISRLKVERPFREGRCEEKKTRERNGALCRCIALLKLFLHPIGSFYAMSGSPFVPTNVCSQKWIKKVESSLPYSLYRLLDLTQRTSRCLSWEQVVRTYEVTGVEFNFLNSFDNLRIFNLQISNTL